MLMMIRNLFECPFLLQNIFLFDLDFGIILNCFIC